MTKLQTYDHSRTTLTIELSDNIKVVKNSYTPSMYSHPINGLAIEDLGKKLKHIFDHNGMWVDTLKM